MQSRLGLGCSHSSSGPGMLPKSALLRVPAGGFRHMFVPMAHLPFPVRNQTWLEASFSDENADVTASNTDFLIALDVPEVKRIADSPTPEQLVGILR